MAVQVLAQSRLRPRRGCWGGGRCSRWGGGTVCCFLVFRGKPEAFPPRLEVALGRGRGGRLELWRDGRGVWRNCAVSLLVRWLKLVVLLLLLLVLVRGGRGVGGRHDCDCDCDGVVAGGGRLVSGTGTESGTASRSGREQSGAAGEQSIRGAADADAIDAMQCEKAW